MWFLKIILLCRFIITSSQDYETEENLGTTKCDETLPKYDIMRSDFNLPTFESFTYSTEYQPEITFETTTGIDTLPEAEAEEIASTTEEEISRINDYNIFGKEDEHFRAYNFSTIGPLHIFEYYDSEEYTRTTNHEIEFTTNELNQSDYNLINIESGFYSTTEYQPEQIETTTENAKVIDFVSEEDYTTEEENIAEGEKKLSYYLFILLEHFKKSDSVSWPNDIVPDPCPVDDSEQAVGLMDRLIMKDTKLYGTSNLKVQYIDADVNKLEFKAAMSLDKLEARGQYILSSWWFPVYQPYNITGTDLTGIATGSLDVQTDGKLHVQDIYIDLICTTMKANFENIGLVGSWIQDWMNSGSLLFDSMKPTLLKDAYTNIRNQVNAKLDEVAGGVLFPNTISPLDMVLIDLRNVVRNMSLDPYHLKDYTSEGIFSISMTNTWIYGVSSLHRTGNITSRVDNNAIVIDFKVGTMKLEGRTRWEISAVNNLISRDGTASFSVEYVGVHVTLKQSLDVRKVPKLENLELDIGNLQIRCDGTGTIDYIIEFVVNILPNLIRYQIIDAIETPLKIIIQKKLNELNVEEILKSRILPEVDRIQESGINLSFFKIPMKNLHDDEFFNF